MQMHIIKEENLKNHIFIDHTLIINEIERSIKFYNWEFILSFLPSGSYLVGGYIRDLILGRLNSLIDVDIVVPKNAIKIGKKIADKFEGKFIILDEARDVVRLIFKHVSVDIASQISPSIEIDLFSRDFSINAIAFSFDKKLLIDPSNGIKDLQLSLLRTHSKQNLLEDPLRILRCFRFVSELNFNVDVNLINVIKTCKNKLSLIASERINYEIQRIIIGSEAAYAIKLINKFKIFDYLQSEKNLIFIDLQKINFEAFSKIEKDKFFPLFFLSQILDEFSLKILKFRKSEIAKIRLLRKWNLLLKRKTIYELDERERFNLHQELENILPSFILFLQESFYIDWLERWRNKDDKLFHPSNLIKGTVLKKYLKIQEGPVLGKVMNYLSMELAFNRLNNFDEAIYKGKQWIQQNAPKCD
ncbi:Poly A polymerase family [Prochlorococcus marinus str. MIT 9515]|uniref:Poly A polymerase family n=1 Tax=Prochlorococcus marinus (strain MIT 9515) TaxID=167542 RepID=A2BUB7_PROM5|nr:CCA tRNA nucleotidyltransferase [Prochlorococcus marinus]ABM71378.1 Poly A polymerase family [Prochlorococcus marinus str. MIT 9515]